MLDIVDVRGSGKTSMLCLYALDNVCDIVVPTRSQVRHELDELKYQADRCGYKVVDMNINSLHGDATFAYYDKTGAKQIIDILAVESISVGRAGSTKPRPHKVVVDEVERCMAMLLSVYGYNYQGFTMGIEH